MHRRLKHNMVAYNSHINDLQSALDASTRELGEVQLLVGQVCQHRALCSNATTVAQVLGYFCFYLRNLLIDFCHLSRSKTQQLENKKREAERELEETKIEIKMAAQVREVELVSLREEADRAQRMLDWRQERRTMRDLAEAQVIDSACQCLCQRQCPGRLHVDMN